jgi:hypothetical protein
MGLESGGPYPGFPCFDMDDSGGCYCYLLDAGVGTSAGPGSDGKLIAAILTGWITNFLSGNRWRSQDYIYTEELNEFIPI